MNDTFGFIRYKEVKKTIKRGRSRAWALGFRIKGGLYLFVKAALELFVSFCIFFAQYAKEKILAGAGAFEKYKNILVRFFMIKRGRYNRPFLHLAAIVVLVFGVILAPYLADTFPIFSNQGSSRYIASIAASQQSINVDQDVFRTEISQKPRDKNITYRVQRGDTISTIAQKFGISTDTIKWSNDLTSDNITVDDELLILPVTGVSHKVSSGETVYTIAKKYDTSPQAIVDFPFNEFANPQTFSLVEGQMLLVPDGVKPSEKVVPRRQVFIAQGPVSISSAGFTWPLRGAISQFPAWYHMALDITSPIGTPVVAAQNGTVVKALSGTWDGGYGINVMIDGSGFQSLYAHLSGLNVSVGDTVSAGQTVIGWVGLTGRTTGAHIHFEIYRNGALVNPLSYLQ